MSSDDRIRWDAVFRERAQSAYPDPDPLLLAYVPPAQASDSRACDVAAGLGQNGLWLAEQGYITDIMDISRVALQRAHSEATRRNLRRANLLPIDLDELTLYPNSYDVVCVFRYLKRELFSPLRLATKRGGRLLYETFNQRYSDLVPGFNRAYLVEVGELASIFRDWRILHAEEEGHISRLVALKA